MEAVTIDNQTKVNGKEWNSDEWLSKKYDEAVAKWQEDEAAQDRLNDAVFNLAMSVLQNMGIDFKDPGDEQVGAAAAVELTDALTAVMDELLWSYFEMIEVLPFGKFGEETVRIYDYLKTKAERAQRCT